MTRSIAFVGWALTGFLLLGSWACSPETTSDSIAVLDVAEKADLSRLTLHVRGMT